MFAAFDLAEEKFREVPLLSSIDDIYSNLVVLGGCLCIYTQCSIYLHDVWVMKEYANKESWTLLPINGIDGFEYRLVCLLGQEQVVLVKDNLLDDDKLSMYDVEKESFKDIVVHGIPDGFWAGWTPTFIKSLVSPHCGATVPVMEQGDKVETFQYSGPLCAFLR